MRRLPLVSPLDRALFLKAQPYLEGLSPSVLAVLASYTEERFYAAGETLRARDAEVDRIFFLGSGAVAVEGSSTARMHGTKVEAPGAVGLAHFFAESRDAPAVIAFEDTLCLEIATDELDQILEDHFSLLLQMARTSCDQASLATRALAHLRHPEIGFRSEDRQETPVELDLVHRLARARRAPFFKDVNLTVLGELFRIDQPDVVRKGDALWREGDPIDRMAFVLDGEFRNDGRFGNCNAPSGSTLGAWEALCHGNRFEGWIAERTARILTIRNDLFIDLLEDHLEFAESYLRRVNQQLVSAWGLLAEKRGAEEAS